MTEEIAICPDCGKGFKDISRHKCKAKQKKEFADAVQQGALDKVDALTQIKPDKFWAWTEGMGIQIGSIISDMTLIEKSSKDIREWCGNMNAFFKEQLNALNTGVADLIDLQKETLKYHKLRLEAIQHTEKNIGTFLKENEQEIKNLTQEDADIEAYEEMTQKEKPVVGFKPVASPKKGGLPKLVSYEEDKELPEHTRKIAGTLQGTSPKAMLIQFYNGKEAWIPKSCSHRDFNENDQNSEQYFVIDSWVLKKNLVIGEDE